MVKKYKKSPDKLLEMWDNNKISYLFILLAIIIGSPVIYFFWKIIKTTQSSQSYELKDWLEILGNYSQFLLVLLGGFVFYQIKIAKDDLKTRCIRESREKSVEIADIFAKEIIPKIDTFTKGVKNKNHTLTNRKLNKYYKNEISTLGQNQELLYKKDIEFLKTNPELYTECVIVLNKLEAIAINFTQGVADEKAVFSALSQVYCNFIRTNSSFLCFLRDQRYNIFTNVLELYRIWSNRIDKEGLLLQSKSLEKQLSEFDKVDEMPPYGVQ